MSKITVADTFADFFGSIACVICGTDKDLSESTLTGNHICGACKRTTERDSAQHSAELHRHNALMDEIARTDCD